jgi:hypothetical protein
LSRKRKRNSIAESFVAHSKEMRESVAWRHLPDNARRILDRLEVEHMRHGGSENGALPCTYTDCEAWGIRRASVALAIRQSVGLGFAALTRQGYRSTAEFRTPSHYRLTYVFGCGTSPDPTNEWRGIATAEQAKAALALAAQAKNYDRQPKRAGAPAEQIAGRVFATEPDAVARPHSARG